VVVAVGLTLVDPLADAEVNVPGAMAILVAPVVAQLSVALVPEFMVVGFATKDVIVGTESFAGVEFDEGDEAQLDTPTETNRVRASAQRASPEERRLRELNLFLQNESGEPICIPFTAVGHTSLVIFDLSCLLAVGTGLDYWSAKGKGQ
jgi:hypothetical protein